MLLRSWLLRSAATLTGEDKGCGSSRGTGFEMLTVMPARSARTGTSAPGSRSTGRPPAPPCCPHGRPVRRACGRSFSGANRRGSGLSSPLAGRWPGRVSAVSASAAPQAHQPAPSLPYTASGQFTSFLDERAVQPTRGGRGDPDGVGRLHAVDRHQRLLTVKAERMAFVHSKLLARRRRLAHHCRTAVRRVGSPTSRPSCGMP